MSVDAEAAIAALLQEQSELQQRIRTLEEERRLFEKLGYSYYYLDMQLRELRSELTLCQYRIRQLGRQSAGLKGGAGGAVAPAASPVQDESRRHLVPVLTAFVVSVLALCAVGLLWLQRFTADDLQPSTTPVAAVSLTPTATATRSPAAPTPDPVVYAVVDTDGLNVRSEASTSAPVLAILRRGEVVILAADAVDDTGQRWYGIESGGWVAGDHVEIYPTREEAEEAAQSLREESQ